MDSNKAVFLSYASEDAETAQRLCADLRSAGIEVWLDQSELRGGDTWDASIRRQINACALFVPLISHHSQARAEGYFRLEWKLAVDRSHLMASDKTFLLPVVIDTTPNAAARVPDKFREVQWTRLEGGEASPAFTASVQRLLALPDTTSPPAPMPERPSTAGARATGGSRSLMITAAILGVCLIAAFIGWRQFGAHPTHADRQSSTAASSDGFSPPAHSLAVLPFVNMSSDKEQEYFSDGLSEELLNSLAKVRDLQVAARTSSFSFKGEKLGLAEIARKLNVGAVLEGSVRKDGSRVRITAQLINAVTGFHLWSQTYDRDLTNVLALQTEIATAVTEALQATLLPGTSAAIELGGTQNPAALDAYLRGTNLQRGNFSKEHLQTRLGAFEEAVRLDPAFAKAYAAYALALSSYATNYAAEAEIPVYSQRARAAAEKAVALAPDLAESHLAMGFILEAGDLNMSAALREYQRALELSPNDPGVLARTGSFYVAVGRTEIGLATTRRALALDPLNEAAYTSAAYLMFYLGDYAEAQIYIDRVLSLNPASRRAAVNRGMLSLANGETDRALVDCASPQPEWVNWTCLALAYDKANRRTESDAQIAVMTRELGNAASYQYAEIYAQRGDVPKALTWLETGYRTRDAGLLNMKIDRLLDPLRQEPRFRELERKLNFPIE
jgi:TolB-like protein